MESSSSKAVLSPESLTAALEMWWPEADVEKLLQLLYLLLQRHFAGGAGAGRVPDPPTPLLSWAGCVWVKWWVRMGTLLADSEAFLVNTQGCDWVCDSPRWLPGECWCTCCGWLPWGGAWGSGKNQGFITVRATCCQAGETVVVQWLNPLGWPFPFLCVLDCRRHTCDGCSWEESKRDYVSPMREHKGTRQVRLAGTGCTSWVAAVVCQLV